MLALNPGKWWILLMFISSIPNFIFQNHFCQSISDTMWSEMGRITGLFLHQCIVEDIEEENKIQSNENIGSIFKECFKRKGLRALDRVLNRDVIEITKNVVLVRWKNDSEVFGENNPKISLMTITRPKTLITNIDWQKELQEKAVTFFKTRILKIRMNSLNIHSEGRHRHKGGMMSHLMMFGLVAAGLIVIPLGFQFLAVLGGKALLLAKLALLLSSINGLKKIATSHMNYGLYSTGHPGHSGVPCKSFLDCNHQLSYDEYALEKPHLWSGYFNIPYWLYGITGDGVDFDESTDENDNDIYFSVDIDTGTPIRSGYYNRHSPHDLESHADIHDLGLSGDLSGAGYSSYHSSLYPREDTVQDASV